MKKGRFLWSAHRITERQKAGKARSIKGKQLKNSRSTASKQPAAHLSSARDNLLLQTAILYEWQFLISRRAAFVIPERLPVPAQASEWGHFASRSAVRRFARRAPQFSKR